MAAKPTAKKKSAPEPVLTTGARPSSLEERAAHVRQRLAKAPVDVQEQYARLLDMSWIYHDSVLEGVVYTQLELKAAFDPADPDVTSQATESNIQPICDEIRRHRAALEFARQWAKRDDIVTVELIREIYHLFRPDDGDSKTAKYRKDIPQHRLYFHEYAAPEKIPAKVKAVVDWLNDPETRRTRSPLRIASRGHYDLLRVFPFQHDSGKVSRLLLNMLLLRAGYPPAIVDSRERQRYYDALKGSSASMSQIIQDSISNGLASVERFLDTYERKPTFVAT
jgi:Fic family protein